MLDNQIGLLQNFALLLQNFALLLQIFTLLLQIFALLFGINCTEIDQSQSSIISLYIITPVTHLAITKIPTFQKYSIQYLQTFKQHERIFCLF